MFKNQASQKIALFAFTVATGAPKTGDATNLTAYISKDHGTVTVLGDTSATEMDATNAPGWYLFDLTQAETNFDDGLFTGKSNTSGVAIVGRPISTVPAGWAVALSTAAIQSIWDALSASLTTVGSIGKRVVDYLDTTVSSRAAASDLAIVAGYIDTEVSAIKAKTDNLPSDPADASDIAAAFATVNSTLSTLSGYVDTEVGAIKVVTDRLGTTLEAAGGSPGEYRFAADALVNAPTGGSAPSAAQIADAVWDEALAGHAVAGSAGKVVGDALDASISSRASQASVDVVDANVDSILVDTGTDIPGMLTVLAGYVDTEVSAIKAKTDNLPANPAATSDIPTALQNADALLNRDMSAVSDTNSRSPLNALRFIRNRWNITGTTLSVKKENDTTEAWNAEVSTTPGADPVTGTDPG